MWALTNQTPYAAYRTWVRDKTGGHHHWIVAVKGTFEITPAGTLRLADEQPLRPRRRGPLQRARARAAARWR